MAAKQLAVKIGDTWQPRLLPYFGMALMATMLVTNILNYKFIDLMGLSVIASMITYVFSLVLADVMAEVYGYRRVRRLLYTGLACLVFYAVCLQIAVWLPPAADYKNNDAFTTIFGQVPRIVTASIAAYFATELTNSFIMSRLKVRLHGRHFMGRATLSVGGAQMVDSVVFFGIAFAGTMPFHDLASAGGIAWLLVMATEIAILPFTRKLALVVKQAEGVEHFDSHPPGMII